MDIPITPDQFLAVFRQYNLAVWPTQVLLLLVAAACVVLAVRGTASRAVATMLGALWLWTGIVYHLLFFTSINPAAYGFAVVFAVQGLLILWTGLARQRLVFRAAPDVRGYFGAALIAYALLVYPLIGATSTHAYPMAPTFGLPCPTTIFTFGLLLWTERPMPRWLLIAPVLWAVIAMGAVMQFGILEDFGLIVSAIAAMTLAFWRHEPAVESLQRA